MRVNWLGARGQDKEVQGLRACAKCLVWPFCPSAHLPACTSQCAESCMPGTHCPLISQPAGQWLARSIPSLNRSAPSPCPVPALPAAHHSQEGARVLPCPDS